MSPPPCILHFLQVLLRGMSEMSLDESITGDEPLTSGRDNLEKYRMVLETLRKIDLCRSERGDCANEQRLLNNMGVHNVVLELIQVPYDKVWNGRVWLRVQREDATRRCYYRV